VNGQGRLVVVSNRLPITIEAAEDGKCLHPSGGGLVNALMSILHESRGCWIGWIGADYDDNVAELLKSWEAGQNYSFVPVFLTAAERSCHYRGFSNEIIWPLFHGLSSRCQFDSRYWHAYQKVNAKFAAAVQSVLRADDVIWVHDYHLMMLAAALRRSGLKQSVAYFHHIPFPSPDIFEILPWRGEILRGLMQFDIVGFQTIRDRRNFVACLRRFLPDIRIRGTGDTLLVRSAHQCVKVGAYPIGVDYDDFAADASKPPAGRKSFRVTAPISSAVTEASSLTIRSGSRENLV
jgi:trehalose-6-phosphate synthase